MANESLKAKLEKYEADCKKAEAKFPEKPNWASRANILTPAAFSRPCIVPVSGPCVCTQASLLLKNPTNVIVT